MIASLTLVLGGIALLYLAAEALVRGAASGAKQLGVNPLVIGVVVIAYGTSMPELVVSVEAAIKDSPDIAVSNIVGSNICTVGVVLGLAVLVRPMKVRLHMIQWHVPIMLGGTILLSWFLWDSMLTRMEGALLVAGIVAYTLANIWAARRERSPEVVEEFETVVNKPHKSLWIDATFIMLGLAGLFIGGSLLIDGATATAREMGISEAVIGLTVVAIGTSCPDIVASMVAAHKGEGDLAVGNAIGSVIFNIFNALGLAAVVTPLVGFAIDPLDLAVMVAIAALTLPLMRSDLELKRWEGGLLVLIYMGYIGVRWPYQ